jgi:hypothetical protein
MRTLIALLLTCAPLWGQGSDAAAPDGERGFGERAELHETVELFRKAKGEDLVFVQGLHQLLSDVRLHVHLARSVYRERGYFELVQGVEEEFAPLFVTADQFDFVAFTREMEEDEARAYARLFYDVRFRARRWLIASSEVDIEELAGAMRLLDAAHRGRVLLQSGWDLQRITSRADLAAARLRAVLKDLEALYEAPANALDELDTTEVEELVTLLRTADKKGKALLPEAGLRLERSAARMVLGTHTLRFDEKHAARLAQRARDRGIAAEAAKEMRLLLPFTTESEDAPGAIKTMSGSDRYRQAVRAGTESLRFNPFHEDLLYLLGEALDFTTSRFVSVAYLDRFLVLRGIRSYDQRTHATRDLDVREDRALFIVSSAPRPGG